MWAVNGYSRGHLAGIRACYLKTLSLFLFLRNCLRSDWEASKLKIVITSITEGGALWIFGMPTIMISQGRNSVTQLHWWKHSMCSVCIWLCVHIEAITRFSSQTRLSELPAVWDLSCLCQEVQCVPWHMWYLLSLSLSRCFPFLSLNLTLQTQRQVDLGNGCLLSVCLWQCLRVAFGTP